MYSLANEPIHKMDSQTYRTYLRLPRVGAGGAVAFQTARSWDFPGGSLVETPCFPCRGRSLLPGWGSSTYLSVQKTNKQTNKQKVLMYSTGNYIQYPVIDHYEKAYLKKNVYMCIIESLCYTAEIGTL